MGINRRKMGTGKKMYGILTPSTAQLEWLHKHEGEWHSSPSSGDLLLQEFGFFYRVYKLRYLNNNNLGIYYII